MKHNYRIFLISILFYFGCSKEQAVLFSETLEVDFTIPAGLNTIETHTFIIKNIQTQFLNQCAIHGIDPQNVQEIFSTFGSFQGKFESVDYSSLSKVQVNAVSATDNNIKGEMYYHEMLPFNATTELKLLSSTTNLINILKDETFQLEIKLNFKSFPIKSTVTRFKLGYAVR